MRDASRDQQDRRRTIALCSLFIACVVSANWALTHVGTDTGPEHPRTIPIGFGLAAPSGVIFAGAILTLRDAIHLRIGPKRTLLLIVAAAPVTAILATPSVALASAVTFVIAETTDLLVFQRLRAHGLIRAALGSNLVGSLVDSFAFLWLAFGLPVAVAGAFPTTLGKLIFASLALPILTHRRRLPPNPL